MKQLNEQIGRIKNIMGINSEVIIENSNPEKLYSKKQITKLVSTKRDGKYLAPKHIRDIVKDLREVDCDKGDGKCVKLPEAVFHYLNQRGML